ncbi:MAG: hypothetical protein COT14_00130 [Candidatus Diapherotrites archaeon CG08_land_8_20_14_0_20_30_16]|nr:MAG: hypothetical protein COT14_00130 [Candidatus Diapherotrites archaeon CG08_land_8_20_14_0_20_30_16]
MLEQYRLENKLLRERYESLAKDYNARLPDYLPHHTKVLQPFVGFLNKDFGPGARVIDLGCGVGLNSCILNKHGFNVTGLDYSKNSIEHAKQNCPNTKFLHTDFLDWQPEEKFHGLVAGSFLDKFHPELLPEVFERLDSLLVYKGYGLMYVPTSKEESQKVDGSYNKKQKYNPYTALLERDNWLQHISKHFKVLEYYPGYGKRDFFISTFQKR